MARSEDYWVKRFEQLEESTRRSASAYVRQLDAEYARAVADIKVDIEKWYGRIATNNGVSLSEARRLLSASELKEFKWSLADYIKYGEENAVSQRWVKQLENASAKVHI